MLDEKGLLRLKEQIDTAKTKASELGGQKDYLMQELNKQYGCKTVEQAETKLEELEETIEDLDNQIKNGLSKLEKQING
jgi:polyhydroxyalkanoate synthesis regulator phasin